MSSSLVAMSKYEAYKDSGAEWLGEIPTTWHCKRMKFLYKDVSQKGMPTAELLSVTQNQGVVPRSWVENRMVMPSGNLESFKFIEKGDFAISLRSFEGGLEYCHHDGIISPAYTVLKRRLESLDRDYYRFLFKSPAFVSELQTSIVGIREGKNISFEELSYSLMPIPPLQEQTAIATFLDRKTAQIDQAVAIKEQQIALLKERKQILIQNAVTRGLDPDAPMRDSGVEWIGEIPAHWRLLSLKRVIRDKLRYGANESGVEYQSDLPRYIRITDFSKDGKLSETSKLSLKWDIGKEYLLDDGDILFARSGATVGKSYQFKKSMSAEKYYAFAGYLIKATPDVTKITSDYLKYYTDSDCFSEWREMIFNKATIENIGADKYSQLPVVLPPLEEQDEIVGHIEAESVKIDKAIDLQQQQIDRLKEYKATLINSAVTGKIKVPGVDDDKSKEVA